MLVGAPNGDGTRGLTYLLFGTDAGFGNINLAVDGALPEGAGITITGDAIGDISGLVGVLAVVYNLILLLLV